MEFSVAQLTGIMIFLSILAMYGWNLRENNIRYKKIIDTFIEKSRSDIVIDNIVANDVVATDIGADKKI